MLPLFGHSMYCPPEAAVSLRTAKGANRFCPDRLSSSIISALLPELLLEEDELELLLEEDELPGRLVGHSPVTGVPSQVPLPVVQSSVQTLFSASTMKP